MRILELFIHSGCFSQINGLGFIRDVLRDFPDISFKEVDMLRETERTAHLGVKISPTLVLDGKIVSIGIPEEEKLRDLLSKKRKGVSHA